MNTEPITLSQADVKKLLGAASSDAALLYLYLRAGNSPEAAQAELNISQARLS